MLTTPISLSSLLTGCLIAHVYPATDGDPFLEERLVKRFGRVITVTLSAPLLVVLSRIEHFVYAILASVTIPLILCKKTKAIPHLFKKLRLSASFTTWWNLWNIPLSFRLLFGEVGLNLRSFRHESFARHALVQQGLVSIPSHVWTLLSIDLLIYSYCFVFMGPLTFNIFNVCWKIYTLGLQLFTGENFRDPIIQPIPTPLQLRNAILVPIQSIPTEQVQLIEITRKTNDGLAFLQKYYKKEFIGDMHNLILENDPVACQFIAERCVYLLSIPLAKDRIPDFLQETTTILIQIFRSVLTCGNLIHIPNSIHHIPSEWTLSTEAEVKKSINTFFSALNNLDLSSSPFKQHIDEIRNLFSILWYGSMVQTVEQQIRREDAQKQVHYLLVTWAMLLRQKNRPNDCYSLLEEFFGKTYPIEEGTGETIQKLEKTEQQRQSPTSDSLTALDPLQIFQERLRLQLQMIANTEWNNYSQCILTRSSFERFLSWCETRNSD